MNMKKDILCYLLLIISISIFIYTTVYLKPIEKESVDEEKFDKHLEEIVLIDIHSKGLENRESIVSKYQGEIDLNNKWVDFVLLFTNYKDEFLEEYELYDSNDQNNGKINYINKVSTRYGIDTQEEREKLYKAFKQNENIIKIEVIEDTIQILEDGVNFEIKATDEKKSELLFNCTIFDKYISKDEFLKIIPKEVTKEIN